MRLIRKKYPQNNKIPKGYYADAKPRGNLTSKTALR